MHVSGQLHGVAFRNLEHRAEPFDQIQAASWSPACRRWQAKCAEISAAAEVAADRRSTSCVASSRPSASSPVISHQGFMAGWPSSFGAFAGSRPDVTAPELIRWIKPFGGHAVGLPTGHTFHGLRAPDRCARRQSPARVPVSSLPNSMAKPLQMVVFRRNHEGGSRMPFQSKDEFEDGLHEVAVGHSGRSTGAVPGSPPRSRCGPQPLPRSPARASFGLPIIRSRAMMAITLTFSSTSALAFGGVLHVLGVLVPAHGHVFVRPFHGLLKFLRDRKCPLPSGARIRTCPPDSHAHAEVLLNEIGIHDRSGDAHRDAAPCQR